MVESVVPVQQHPVVERVINPILDDLLISEKSCTIRAHLACPPRCAPHPAVVPMQMPALPLVFQHRVPIAEFDVLGDF